MITAQAAKVCRNGQLLLDNIDLAIENGELLGIVGPNGAGKSTLLRSLYGAVALDSGEIQIDGARLANMTRRATARRIAVVPQGQQLDPNQSVHEMIALGRLPHQSWFGSRDNRDESAIAQAIGRVGLADKVDAPIGRLSGGEVQRALIARALCQGADHLLLDEPTNHLDLAFQHDVLSLVRSLGLGTLIVLHDLNLAARYCDRIGILDAGRLLAIGRPNDVLTPERVTQIYRIPTTLVLTPAGRQHLVFADMPNSTETAS